MKIRDKHIITVILAAIMHVQHAAAQSGTTGYSFVDIPVSAHAAALGGTATSLVQDDVTLCFMNPALLPNASNNSLVFTFTTYMASSTKLSTAFSRRIGDRATWAVCAQVLSYGKMKETDSFGEEIGSFSASDIDIQGSFAYMLSDRWTGGISLKALVSNYANYSAFGMGVDLGVNYYDEDDDISISVTGHNLGGEIKALNDNRRKLPLALGASIAKGLDFLPVTIHLGLNDLTRWSNINLWKHIALGIDVYPTNNVWVALGYNIRRSAEMKALDSSHFAGFSLGAGINIKKVKVGVAWGKYHIASSSLIANIAYSF